MIITEAQPSSNSLGLRTVEASVKASAFMYKVYYSSLYERKEEAVIRELSANAWDAHQAAGKEDVPITICLPTELDPYLRITDEGIGMSLSDVENIFAVYGESSKSSTNDQIGGFGYGGKSPYAIADTFTISTTHKGLTTEVIATMDKGIPVFLIDNKGDIGKEDGTSVSVPVDDTHHISKLMTACREVFTYWDVKPHVQNLEGPGLPTFDPTKNFDGRLILEEGDSSGFSTVVIGNFKYSIPYSIANEIRDLESVKAFNRILRVRGLGAVLKMPIGALELSPSRERIEDTKENQQIVINAVLEAIAHYEEQSVDLDKENTTALLKIIEEHTYRQTPMTYKHGEVYGADISSINERVKKEILNSDSSLLLAYWYSTKLQNAKYLMERLEKLGLVDEAYGLLWISSDVGRLTYYSGLKIWVKDLPEEGKTVDTYVRLLSFLDVVPSSQELNTALFAGTNSYGHTPHCRLYSRVTSDDFRVTTTSAGILPIRGAGNENCFIIISDNITAPRLRSFIRHLRDEGHTPFQVGVYSPDAKLDVKKYIEVAKKFLSTNVTVCTEEDVETAFKNDDTRRTKTPRARSANTPRRSALQRWETERYIYPMQDELSLATATFDEFEASLAEMNTPVYVILGRICAYSFKIRLSQQGMVYHFNESGSLFTKPFHKKMEDLQKTYPNLVVLNGVEALPEVKQKYPNTYQGLKTPIEDAFKSYIITRSRSTGMLNEVAKTFFGTEIAEVISLPNVNVYSYPLRPYLSRTTYARLLGANVMYQEVRDEGIYEELLTKKEIAAIRVAVNKLVKELTENDPTFIDKLVDYVYGF